MKKTALLAVALATCLGYVPARATEVVSSNVVGYQKLEMKAAGYTMIANPFVEVGTGELIVIADMFADDAVAATSGGSASDADNIKVWNGSGYNTYWFRKPKKGNSFWVSDEDITVETQSTLPEGNGAFYVNNAPTNEVLTISGEVRSTDQTLRIYPGYNLLENPFPTELPITAFTVAGAKSGGSASDADNIKLWNGSGYDTYWFRKPKKGDSFWVSDADITVETSAMISSGAGIFYLSRANVAEGDPEYFEVSIESPIAQ